MAVDLTQATWRTSAMAPGNAGHVEIADIGDHVAMRNSANPNDPVLVFTAFEWECFLDGVAKGEFWRPATRQANRRPWSSTT